MSERKSSCLDPITKQAAAAEDTVTSVQALERLLRSVISAPTELPEELRCLLKTSLSTQNGMARLDLPEHGVHPRWLNTLKARAGEAVTGGFEVLDALRKEALQVLAGCDARREQPSRGTKNVLREQLAKEQQTVHQLVDEIAMVSAKLKEYVALAQSYANKAGDLDGFQRRHMELMRKYRSLPTRD